MAAQLETLASFNSFKGIVSYYSHASAATNCEMTFAVYLPAQAKQESVSAIVWLSGLTCNHENFITKAGAQHYADEHGVMLIMPDTSPRNVNIPAAEPDYDLGYGAGFYVDATQVPWAKNFNMYGYIIDELIPLCQRELPIKPGKVGIMGHSMGGHGAMVLGLRNPALFSSISAFSPICAPSQVPWGDKIFTAYLGAERKDWLAYDSCDLIAKGAEHLPLRVEQGDADQFLNEQLQPELLQKACESENYPLDYHLRRGFDHSYYFIASFIGEHIAFHAKHLTR
jgi:S-formylglutathione hydrolase